MPRQCQVENRVRDLRDRLGLRQSDLAREIGVTRQTIIAIEKGRLNPSILIALKIARVLREPVDYVFYLPMRQDAVPASASSAPRPFAVAEPEESESPEPEAIVEELLPRPFAPPAERAGGDAPGSDTAPKESAEETPRRDAGEGAEDSGASDVIWDFS